MIFVECKPDEMLVRNVTGLPKRQIIHELKGKAEVCKRVSGQQNCKGVVDEDPGSTEPVYLARINLSEELLQLGLKVFEDGPRNNRVVVLCPKLEDWILRATRDARLDITKYGLPNDPTALHRVINLDPRKIERLLGDLRNAATERMKTLAQLLK